jgi:glutamyl-tRNA reductase
VGEDAFRYLVRLAAGLESIVLGEREIVGQVRETARLASPELAALLGRSLAAARAFRRRHNFTTDSGHLFDIAVARADRMPASLVVVGSGPTARCIARRAGTVGVGATTVASRRKPDWAVDLSLPWIPLDQLSSLPRSGMAMVCLGGDAPVLLPGEVQADVIVDVSTPRRTGAGAADVATLRDLREHVVLAEASKRELLAADLEIEARRALTAWTEDRQSPVGRFRHSAEELRQAEVARIRRRHPEIPPETLEVITRSLMNRFLHAPSMRLRSLEPELASAVSELFERRPERTPRWQE